MKKVRLNKQQAKWLHTIVTLWMEGTCDMLQDYSSHHSVNDLKDCIDEAKESFNTGTHILDQLDK